MLSCSRRYSLPSRITGCDQLGRSPLPGTLNEPTSVYFFGDAVNVVAEEHYAAVLVGHLRIESVNLLDVDTPFGGRHLLEEDAAPFVTDGEVGQIALDDGRGNDGRRLVDRVRPQELAVRGPHSDRPAGRVLHVDLRPADVGNHDAGVGRPAVAGPARLPNEGAGFLVERDHRLPRSTGGADQAIAVDQHRFAVAPAIPFATFKILLHPFAPALLAVGRVETNQLAVGGEEVDHVAVDSRRASRALPTRLPGSPGLTGHLAPEPLAGLAIEADGVFVFVLFARGAVAQRENAIAGNRQARIAAARALHVPDQRRPVG